jgi:hypothetical protein
MNCDACCARSDMPFPLPRANSRAAGENCLSSTNRDLLSAGIMDDEALFFTCDAVYLLRASGTCYTCKKPTPMFAWMALPPFTFPSQDAEDDYALDDEGCMLRDVGALPAGLAANADHTSAGSYRLDFSRTARSRYWMNHCQHCDAKQGDFFVHGVDGPFHPYDQAQLDAIDATRLEGPFRFEDTGTAYSGCMADWRDRRHGVTRPDPLARTRRNPKSVAAGSAVASRKVAAKKTKS